jgi:hypothetical protein
MYLAVVSGPELEYSEDEDFIESAEDIISGSQYKQGAGDGPYPPAYGKHLQEGQLEVGCNSIYARAVAVCCQATARPRKAARRKRRPLRRSMGTAAVMVRPAEAVAGASLRSLCRLFRREGINTVSGDNAAAATTCGYLFFFNAGERSRHTLFMFCTVTDSEQLRRPD